MKPSMCGLVTLFLILAFAAYFRSWWLVMCAFFVFTIEYIAQEFNDVKQRLTKIEKQVTLVSPSE
jgi:hypothetical protein